MRRAARFDLPLPLGRDGSEPEQETDSFDGSEPFLRWLQTLSSLFFGTYLGRLLTLYALLPFLSKNGNS